MRSNDVEFPKTCGPYKVTFDRATIFITCEADGGETSELPASEAIGFAERLRGPLGRFTVHATRENRFDLARQIEAAYHEIRLAHCIHGTYLVGPDGVPQLCVFCNAENEAE